jgi:hypothetical protein
MPVRERQDRYKRVVAAVTVRTLHGVFEADRSEIAETIVFNGHVDATRERACQSWTSWFTMSCTALRAAAVLVGGLRRVNSGVPIRVSAVITP